jgi:hypothetical protein
MLVCFTISSIGVFKCYAISTPMDISVYLPA